MAMGLDGLEMLDDGTTGTIQVDCRVCVCVTRDLFARYPHMNVQKIVSHRVIVWEPFG